MIPAVKPNREVLDQWSAVEKLAPGDTIRGTQVHSLQSLFARIVLFFSELFSGGRAKHDKEVYQAFYQDIAPVVEDLTAQIRQEADLKRDMPMARTLLKMQSKIEISGLKAPQNDFEDKITALQQAAQEKLDAFKALEGIDPKEKQEIVSWIGANKTQRIFAAHQNAPIPMAWKDIPKGAVILYNQHSLELCTKLQGRKLRFEHHLARVKSFFCRVFTGKVYTHAELSLGNGQTFDLDKKQGTLCAGQVKIQDRAFDRNGDPRICYYDIVAPDHEALVQAYNEKFPEAGVASFDELWAKIEDVARKEHQNVTAAFTDIIRVVFAGRRSKDYDCKASWDPANKHYGCSATISALYGNFGVDIGQEFNKKVDNISPADFTRSHFFKPLYCLA